ncbi:hypothetical protein, partial [uncultured Nitratireductor sp.]|uniref:hypothetical protein n=1 Tax=uncultured Nitratireductor sp. TaxID=520953 RepID=UPI0025D261D7
MALRSLLRFGLSTIYADESDDKFIYVIACIVIPTLIRRSVVLTHVEWDRYLDGAKQWRRDLRQNHGIPSTKELKGSELASGHNSYGAGGGRLAGQAAVTAYQDALSSLSFLAPGSIFSVYATRG